MAKKNEFSENDLIKSYMDYVLMHNSSPLNVYEFMNNNKQEESLFYKYFTSFEELEKTIFPRLSVVRTFGAKCGVD